jgi:hypothetical protein
MAQARIPGSVGLKRNNLPAGARVLPNALGPGPHSTKGGAAPGPIGLRLWQEDPTASPKAGPTSSKPRALIIIGTGHDSIQKGVRLKGDTYFDKAALASFAAFTPSHDVTLRHVKSAKEMKELIEGGTWDVVIYFGHGVENQMALAPDERGRILKKEEFAQALQKAQVKKVYLFGCKAGQTGLARQLSKDVPGATVYGTFGSLDVDWEQRKDPDGTFTNKFDFKEPLTEYTGGFQTKDGRKTKQRRHERGDPITMGDDPLGGELMVNQ